MGCYSGGLWIAFNAEPQDIPIDILSDDITCAGWFANPDIVYGIGDTLGDAVNDLKVKLKVAEMNDYKVDKE